MDAEAYIVVDPSTREDIYTRMLEAKRERRLLSLTLRTDDDSSSVHTREVEVFVRQTNVDDFGAEFVAGYFIEGHEKYLINLVIPISDDEAVAAKIATTSSE